MKKIKISILIIAVLLVGMVCSYSNAATSSSTTSGEQTIPDGIYIISSLFLLFELTPPTFFTLKSIMILNNQCLYVFHPK